MLQDILPYQLDISYMYKEPDKEDYVLFFQDNKVLLNLENSKVKITTYYEIVENLQDFYENLIYLFSIDKHAYYLIYNVELDANRIEEKLDSTTFYFEDIQETQKIQPMLTAFATATSYHIYHWYTNNKFCGRCGNYVSLSNRERAIYCKCCNITKYPNIAPVVIVGIINGDKILMTRYARGSYRKLALVAGFVEVGETPEDAIQREVMEEVGLKVKNIRYYKSQPWAYSQSLLLGFFADLDGSIETTIDADELSEAIWVSREDIPQNESNFSLTFEMTELFRNNKI